MKPSTAVQPQLSGIGRSSSASFPTGMRYPWRARPCCRSGTAYSCRQRHMGCGARLEAKMSAADDSTVECPPSMLDCRRRDLLLGSLAGSAALFGSAAGPFFRASAGEGSGEPALLLASLPAASLGAGKTAIVTGASSGIGFMVAADLLRQGFTVVPAARSLSRTKATADRLLSQVPGGKLELLDEPCDLSSIQSVQSFTSSYLSSGLPLDVLMECAGIAWCDESTSADGLELQFATNHLGHFHLTNRLMPLLRDSAKRSTSVPRLVVMSSAAHYAGSCNPAALVGDVPAHPYNRWINYCDSKLCNVLFAKEVARREAGILATSVHPGIVNTDLIRYITPPRIMSMKAEDPEGSLRAGKMLGLRTPAEGAEGAVWLATAAVEDEVSGGYYQGLAPSKLTEPAAAAQDPALAAGLWAASEVLVARALGEPEPLEAYEVASSFGAKGEDQVDQALPGFVRMQLSNTAGG